MWLEVPQFRFRTRNILCLGSSAVLLSHTEQSVTWSSSVSHNILWLEFPQFRFRKKRRHLKFPTSASVREHYFSLENPFSFNHPPISQFSCWLTRLMDPLNDREIKGIGMLLEKSSLTFGCVRHKLMTLCSYWHSSRLSGQAGFALWPRERGSFIMLTHLRQRFWTATVSARRYGLSASTIHNHLRNKKKVSSVRTALKRSDNDETSQACLCAMG